MGVETHNCASLRVGGTSGEVEIHRLTPEFTLSVAEGVIHVPSYGRDGKPHSVRNASLGTLSLQIEK